MQPRTRAGIDFELSLQSDLWVQNEQKPKMVWDVVGRNVFEKMKNVDYDVTKFNLCDTSVLTKYDFTFHNNKDLAFEVKRYEKSKLNKWTLYSEPFFKVSTRAELEKIDTQTYNKFVSDFFTKRKDIINKVLENISKNTLGIRVLDEFIPQHNIEYRAEILKGWGGYDRITIQFRIKDKKSL
jgi:hypothetical protein